MIGNRFPPTQLQARKFVFKHPVKKNKIEIMAPPPQDPIHKACI